MSELCVVFERASDAHAFRLAMKGQTEATAPLPFEPFLGEKEFEDLRWYLEDYLGLPVGGSLVRARRVERALMVWGRRLHDALFEQGAGRALLQSLLDAAPPRLLTLVTDDPLMVRQPWELMAGASGPLSRLGVTVRRRLGPSAGLPPAIRLPVRILIVVSRPEDAGFIDPRVTPRQTLDALEPLASQVVVDFCRPPTLAQLGQMLEQGYARGEPYHVLHFDGHGDFPESTGVGVLYFESEPSGGRTGTDPVSAPVLGAMLSRWPVAMTILEACRSSQVGPASASLSVAPGLLAAGIHSVIAMSHAVQVEATRILLGEFYRRLAAGATVGQALEAGRAALAEHPRRGPEPDSRDTSLELQDWFLPQLYQAGPDVPLVPPGGAEMAPSARQSRRPAEADGAAFPPPPRHGFHGRALELHRLEQAFRRSRTALLHGMGGMGKTSLAREAAFWWSRSGLFPDGACFLSFEQGGGPERVAQALGTYLEGPEFLRRPADEQRRRAGELFQQRPVLMVWDNFESLLPAFDAGPGGPALYADGVRAEILRLYHEWTAPADGRGRLLVTCRSPEAGLAGAEPFEMGCLRRTESTHLLTSVLRASGVELSDPRLGPNNLHALLDMLGDHPLSIELVGPHLKALRLEEIIARFHELLPRFVGEAGEEQNRSLLASLAFSSERLSPQARDALPWLGLFRVGVFEQLWLEVTRMAPAGWAAVRAELEALGLVQVEGDVLLANRPYLRFHPTLPYAAAATPLLDPKGARERFVIGYIQLCYNIAKVLLSPQSLGGLAVMSREEANLRNAAQWAAEPDIARLFAGLMGMYLGRVGRLTEQSAWTAWLASRTNDGELTEAGAQIERAEAWSLFSQGRTAEAVRRLETHIRRLQTATRFDPSVELARAYGTLGRIYSHAGLCERAVPILQNVVKANEDLLTRAWEQRQSSVGARDESDDAKVAALAEGLSNALLDLAHALKAVGRLDEAEQTARRQLDFCRTSIAGYSLGTNLAVGLHRLATILMDQGRLREAEATYAEAIVAVRLSTNIGLEAVILQGAGMAADRLGEPDRAAALWKESLLLSQKINDEAEVMRTCNLLGVAEFDAGRLPEARAWYERAGEIAERRGDQTILGAVLSNTVNIDLREGEAAQTNADESAALRYFESAAARARRALAIWEELADRPHAAMTHGQQARVHLHMGEPEEAARHARQALEIAESLGLTEHLDAYYQILSNAARALGDEAQAVAWAQKQETTERQKRAEERWPPEMVRAFGSLAEACGRAGLGLSPLPSDAEQILSQLEAGPPPFADLGTFLRRLSCGVLSDVPPDLPWEVQGVLAQVIADAKHLGMGS